MYDGPYTDDACDVVFKPAGMNHILRTSLVGKTFVPLDAHFDHKPNGVFLASGPAFDRTADVEELSLTDVAPTVMASLGRDVLERMTGSVPERLLTTSVSYSEYDGVTAGGTTETDVRDDRLEERLADLGYMG